MRLWPLFLCLWAWGQSEPVIEEQVRVTETLRGADAVEPPRSVTRVVVDLEAEPARSLSELGAETPGLLVLPRGNPSQGDRLMIRGAGARAPFGVRGVQVLLDGVPLTTADGTTQLGPIDLDSLAAVELVRGPGSSLYGNAAGGVVELTSGSRDGAVRLSAGSEALGALRARKGLRLGDTELWVAGSFEEGDSFRDHADFQETRLQLHVTHALSERWSLKGVTHYYDAPYLLNPSSLDAETASREPQTARAFIQRRGASKVVDQRQLGLSLNYVDTELAWRTTFHGVTRDLYNPIPSEVIDLDRRDWGLRSEVHVGRQFTAGVTYQAQRDDRREFENLGLPGPPEDFAPSDVPDAVQRGALLRDQRERVTAWGAFAEYGRPWGEHWRATVGARYDRFRFRADDRFLNDGDDRGRRSFDQFSPTAALLRTDTQGAWFLNVATAFQTPTANELSNREDGGGGFNEALDPERTTGVDVGRRVQRGVWLWDATLFYAETRDLIRAFEGADERTFFRNAAEARKRGAELSVALQTPLRRGMLDVQSAYTYVDFDIRDADETDLIGQALPGVPEHYGQVQIRWSDEPWNLIWRTRHQGRTPTADRGSIFDTGHTISDLRATYTVNSWVFGIGVDNLFDRRYNTSITPNAFGGRFFEPGPDRAWYGSITRQF